MLFNRFSLSALGVNVLLGGLAAPAFAQSELFSNLESFSYSEPVTVKAGFNDLDGDFTPGDDAFTHNEVEVGWRQDSWRVSLFARYDYQLRFHPDMAELIYLKNNNQGVEPERQYQLAFEANRASSVGVRVGYDWKPRDNVSLSVAGSLLRATKLQQGHISGNAATDNNGNYSGDFALDYVYDEERIFAGTVSAPTGIGVTADLSLRWWLMPQLSLSAAVRDLYSHIRWEDAPFARATGTTNTVPIGEDGVPDPVPFLTAVRGQRTHHQRLPIRSDSWLSWHPSDSLALSAGFYQYDDLWFPRLRVQSTLGRVDWQLMWDIKAQALGVGLVNDWVQLSLISDDLEFHQAHAFGLQLGVAFPL